jgi:flagellar biosynthetic protein FliR
MLSFTDAQLDAWLATLLWPLARVLGLVMVAPVLGHASVPVRVKIGLGVFVTLIVAPTLPPVPQVALASWSGLFILGREILIGIGIGFVMRIAFAAIEAAGEIMGLQMGLGFASFFDPQSAANTLVIGQFMNLLAVLVFVAVNAHLFLINALADSFALLPMAAAPLAGKGFFALADYGATVFSTGLQLALPLVAVLLLTNLALGILTRAAPQLNIFAIGFPVTLGIGLIGLSLVLPILAPQFERLFGDALRAALHIAGALKPG